MAYARMERRGGQMPLECDAEHIVDCFTGKSSNPWPHVGQRHVKERIVRCRDCTYCTDSPAWPGAFECDYISRGVEPDGYCAWGEFRED